MRTIKRYILPLFTLVLITVGAAMPLAVSQMQDSRINSLREEFLLNTVNLTLQQDVGVSPVLRLIAGECNSILWEEETKLTEQDAIEAAKAVLTEMEAMDLLSVGDLALIRDAEGRAEPILLIGGDGSSALVWNWYSYSENVPYQMWIDDTTGKAVQFLVSSPTPRDTDAAHALVANWNIFFQGYYGIEIVSVKEESQGIDSGGILYQFVFGADLQDGLDVCELELELFDGITTFNFN